MRPLWASIGDLAFLALLKEGGIDACLSDHQHASYPGAAAGVALIAQARLGGGARRPIGSTDLSPKAIGIVEIDEDGSVVAYKLAVPDFERRNDDTAFPVVVSEEPYRLVRRDLDAR